jgi:hypothetical protein
MERRSSTAGTAFGSTGRADNQNRRYQDSPSRAMTTDDDLATWTYKEFCKSPYLPLYIECFRRGWTGEKLAEAYEQAILTWQYDGFTGKPPLKLVLEAILDGVCDHRRQ